ncbi:MAG TPA: hypothetical protein VF905_03890 [Nitrospirota bacterium]
MTNEQIRPEEAREQKALWKKWDPTFVNHCWEQCTALGGITFTAVSGHDKNAGHFEGEP